MARINVDDGFELIGRKAATAIGLESVENWWTWSIGPGSGFDLSFEAPTEEGAFADLGKEVMSMLREGSVKHPYIGHEVSLACYERIEQSVGSIDSAEYQYYMARMKGVLAVKPYRWVAAFKDYFMMLVDENLCWGTRRSDGTFDTTNLTDPDLSAWDANWKAELDVWLRRPVFSHAPFEAPAFSEAAKALGFVDVNEMSNHQAWLNMRKEDLEAATQYQTSPEAQARREAIAAKLGVPPEDIVWVDPFPPGVRNVLVRCEESDLSFLKTLGVEGQYHADLGGVEALIDDDTQAILRTFVADFRVEPFVTTEPASGTDRHPGLMASYARLHDIVSDCLDGGRIREANLPGDCQTLAGAVAACNAAKNDSPALEARLKLITVLSGVVDERNQERLDLIQRIASWSPDRDYSMGDLVKEADSFFALRVDVEPQPF